ncbi:MAG: hypothetical protein FJX25_19175 [Alphaproteobacteria bacterium]|nr:hypothetical protein [Alphaproteobacteria bacterium]
MLSITHPQGHSIEQCAAQALAAHRRLQVSAQAARECLPFSTRLMLDRVCKLSPEKLFAAPQLSVADELLIRLQNDMASAGGAPAVRHTEEGDRYTIGGTDAGRCIQAASEGLSDLLKLCWKVSDCLRADAAIASHRAALAQGTSEGASL